MSRLRHDAGLAAEEAAERLYLAEGAATLARRVRTPLGEIDLIVAAGDEVIFVEVKARATHAAAAESLGARQQARLVAAGEWWLEQNGHPPLTPCRFDVVTQDASGTVERLTNAFGA